MANSIFGRDITVVQGLAGIGLAALLLSAAGCGHPVSGDVASAPATTATTPMTPTTGTLPPPTTVPCAIPTTPGTAATVPVHQTCSASGAPHFDTPEAAMSYLASAWNSNDVREIDYVTDPAGRAQMDSMASLMVNLQFKSCTENPAVGDYTCYFTHDIARSSTSTTYPNPMNYPPGEAVFTVAPAEAPGWYLTEVLHCG